MTRAPSTHRATAAVLALLVGGVLTLLGAVPAQAAGGTVRDLLVMTVALVTGVAAVLVARGRRAAR